jgi:4-diphosphocytidyl-2-C-methyl-D-erythritol kinase
MCTVGLFDELIIENAPANSLTCNDPTIPTDSKNLIIKTAEQLGVTAHFNLTKRIPAGGGLAGGSSNAARTLVGLNHLFNLGKSQAALDETARKLGSDVSFFLHGPSSVCAGVGELVRPISRPAARWALLILPSFGMPTPQVYKRFDQLKLGRNEHLHDSIDWRAWTRLSALELLPKLVNDLEAPAFDLNLELKNLRADWEQRLGRIVRMSGSGSTLFTLYDDKSAAEAAINSDKNIEDNSVRTLAVELAPDFADDLRQAKAR